MPKFKIKSDDQSLTVKVKVPSSEGLQMEGIDYLQRYMVRGLLHPNVISSFSFKGVEYTGPYGESLADWLTQPLSSYDYYHIVMQILDLAERMAANSMPMGYLEPDLEHIFINPYTKEINFIYLPLAVLNPEFDIRTLIDSISMNFIPGDQDADQARNMFANYMFSLGYPDLMQMQQFIQGQNPTVVKNVKKQGIGRTGPSGFIGDKASIQQNFQNAFGQPGGMNQQNSFQQSNQQAGMNGNMNMNQNGFGFVQTTNMQSASNQNFQFQNMNNAGSQTGPSNYGYGPSNEDETTLLYDGGSGVFDSEDTMLLDGSTNGAAAPEPSYELERVRTGEHIAINRSVFRIGRERSCSDYQVADNRSVGRAHADIVLRNGSCFVVDRNSMNRTFIDNVPLVPQQETSIHDGARLKLADEEFIFRQIS